MLDEEPVLSASRLKARGGISYADCFAVATAQRHRLPLVTGDPEILALDGEVEVIDPR
ncbi:MAG: PIN domain-containing protein [Solirubrobacteraceae bacterium]